MRLVLRGWVSMPFRSSSSRIYRRSGVRPYKPKATAATDKYFSFGKRRATNRVEGYRVWFSTSHDGPQGSTVGVVGGISRANIIRRFTAQVAPRVRIAVGNIETFPYRSPALPNFFFRLTAHTESTNTPRIYPRSSFCTAVDGCATYSYLIAA